jgi:hypothetical protein
MTWRARHRIGPVVRERRSVAGCGAPSADLESPTLSLQERRAMQGCPQATSGAGPLGPSFPLSDDQSVYERRRDPGVRVRDLFSGPNWTEAG